MADEYSERQMHVLPVFLRTHSYLVGRIERSLAMAPVIPLTWYDIVLEVARAPGKRLTMGEICDRIVLSKSGLTRSVDRLVEEGYLEREQCSKDRRSFYANITRSGEKALERAWPVYRKAIEEYFLRYLTDEEAEV